MTDTTVTMEAQTASIIRELRIPVHRIGYSLLCAAIPYYRADVTRSLSKEVYPYAAERFGCVNEQAVEQAIRAVIRTAFTLGDKDAWERYFPGIRKAPTNKQFIATVAQRLG